MDMMKAYQFNSAMTAAQAGADYQRLGHLNYSP